MFLAQTFITEVREWFREFGPETVFAFLALIILVLFLWLLVRPMFKIVGEYRKDRVAEGQKVEAERKRSETQKLKDDAKIEKLQGQVDELVTDFKATINTALEVNSNQAQQQTVRHKEMMEMWQRLADQIDQRDETYAKLAGAVLTIDQGMVTLAAEQVSILTAVKQIATKSEADARTSTAVNLILEKLAILENNLKQANESIHGDGGVKVMLAELQDDVRKLIEMCQDTRSQEETKDESLQDRADDGRGAFLDHDHGLEGSGADA